MKGKEKEKRINENKDYNDNKMDKITKRTNKTKFEFNYLPIEIQKRIVKHLGITTCVSLGQLYLVMLLLYPYPCINQNNHSQQKEAFLKQRRKISTCIHVKYTQTSIHAFSFYTYT